MNDYWFESGLLREQILKAIYRSKKVLIISKEGISVNGGKPYELYERGIITVDQLENILSDSI